MLAEPGGVLDLWDLTPPLIPPRSRLFCLPPIGIGTPGVESLTGYVARLATAHGVLVRRLVADEILPLLGRAYLLGPAHAGRTSSFWQDSEARALNGTGTLARDVGRVLERLTRRDDLRLLTMRPWAEVVPVTGLLRRHRAWCPVCYEEWRQAGQVIYEPLLWTLAAVTVCPRHQRRLHQVCPHPACRRRVSVLGPRSCPGYCPACGQWLGFPAAGHRGREEGLTSEELHAQLWVSAALGELLEGAPGLSTPPTRSRLAQVVAVYVETVAEGQMTRFARELGFSLSTVAQWCWGTTVPSLALVLQACYRLGTTPWCLFTADLDSLRAAASARPLRVGATLLDVPRRPRAVRQAFDTAAMRTALEAVLASAAQPPPPMRQVARRLGHGHADLIHHLPELCHAISARYLADRRRNGAKKKQRLCAEVRQAAVHLHQQGLYPSASRIATLISQPGFVRDPAAIAERKDVLRALAVRT
jgi:hypothetical protein